MKNKILLSVTILSAQQSKQTQDIGCSHLVTARTMKMLKIAKVAKVLLVTFIYTYIFTHIHKTRESYRNYLCNLCRL